MPIPTGHLYCGDCREVLKDFPTNHFDAVVTDPPSGISLLGLDWDTFKPSENATDLEVFQKFLLQAFSETYRVLKPGGFCLVWALPRTSHHTAMALERSGFEIRDRIIHMFGQGRAKNYTVARALDAKAGFPHGANDPAVSPEAKAYEWAGTALKPGYEDWILVRKPIEGEVLDNLLAFGTGVLNIDASRVYTDWEEEDRPASWKKSGYTAKPDAKKIASPPGQGIYCHPLGRWPTNLVFSHSYDCVKTGVNQFDCVEGCPVGALAKQNPGAVRYFKTFEPDYDDPFLYAAKPSTYEKNLGLKDIQNTHPTPKSLALMRYLVKLVTPPSGVVLDLFAGSGTTLVAAIEEGFDFLGIENDLDFYQIGGARVKHSLDNRKEIQEFQEFFDE